MAWALLGAVSALMGMYAALYRLRRAVFYQLFSYFNYVTALAFAAAARMDCQRAVAALAQRPRCGLHGAPGWLARRGFADGPG